ncbi:hypothetical protein HYD79_03830 [Mycoplasmopsis bovis]|nr:hypothetical protein [Mycoplasmopsis bovis]QQH42984.1 hypothetical protein HYD79_03830 [Mycoplasmopsis bovis]
MKKSKFLLLGSVALCFNSLCSAKCGETKEEKKLEADKPDQSTPANQIKVHQLTQDKVHQLTRSRYTS